LPGGYERPVARGIGLVLGLALVPVARAAPAAIAQTQTNYLLGFVESSGCEFYRNGSWYDSKKAHVHLSYKYQMLVARDQINTAEDCGRPYRIRCSGGEGAYEQPV